MNIIGQQVGTEVIFRDSIGDKMFLVEPVAGAVIGKIWEERKLIAGFASDFYDLLSKGRLSIFVFGCAGTGKSTFGKILDGQQDLAMLSGEYSLSSDTEYYGLKEKRFVTVAVPPGQQVYHHRNWAQLYNALQNSKRSVVINLCCSGFHSAEHDDLSTLSEFSNGINDQSRAKFLENRSRLELTTLDQLIQPLSNYQHPLHMITLVTKQDLWWGDRTAVQTHYENGLYSQKIQQIRDAKGSANFTHHFRSVSFGQINFRTADRHVLFETAAGYDNIALTSNFRSFIDLLQQIAK